MADQLPECEAHGTPTRLTCAECSTPICPKCLVKTSVGLKCQEHAQRVAPRFAPSSGTLTLVALVAVAVAAIVLGLVALRQQADERSARAPVDDADAGGAAVPDRVEPAQIFVVDADGSSPRTLTNRRLAFDGNPAWSPDGQSIAFESTQEGRRAIWVMQSDGLRLRRLTEGTSADASPAWSPDSRQVVFMSARGGNEDIYVIGADGTGVRRLTDDPGGDGFPAWSPDGARIAFVSNRGGSPAIWVMGADGSAPVQVVAGPVAFSRPAWSPDGTSLAFASDVGGADLDIYVAGLDGRLPTPLVTGPGQDGEPAWSPDGRRLAFASDRSGAPQVYVVDRDGSRPVQLTTRPRSFAPTWAPDGSKLAFVNDPAPGS